MQLTVENIGIIKKANVTIDGLTVIAGNNDTGKSTIGKIYFQLLSRLVDIKKTLKKIKKKI